MADEVLFVSMTTCAAVGVPTSCVPKLMLVGETEMAATSGKSATNAFDTALFKGRLKCSSGYRQIRRTGHTGDVSVEGRGNGDPVANIVDPARSVPAEIAGVKQIG